jgi:hypothetical protein
MRTGSCFVIFTAVVGIAQAQINVVASSSSGQTNLQPQLAYITFVPSNANTDVEAAKGAAIGAAEGQAVTAVVVRTLPIPWVGGAIAEFGVRKLGKMFHPDKPIKGFNVAFIKGLSARTILQRGETTFTIPTQALEGGNPVLVRVKVSSKDSVRIVRSVHTSMKMKNGQFPTEMAETKILGVSEDVVPCRQDVRGPDVILTPTSALASGEYAVIMVPGQQDAVPVIGSSVWDFRVM